MMSKYLFYLFVISLNIRFLWTQIVSDDHQTIDRAISATNYLNLSHKLAANQSTTSNAGSDRNRNSGLAEEVRQMQKLMSSVSEVPSYDCQDSVFAFSMILSQYVECLLINSMPFSLCLSCSQQYSNLVNGYDQLNNSTYSNCSSDVLNGDKLDLIHDFYTNSIGKWDNGNCNSCFEGKDQNQYLVVNNDTKYYYQLAENYTYCVTNQSRSNDSCILCKQIFNSVNDYYESLSLNYSNHVCNDIIDSMKDIRKHWSQSLDCPIEELESSLHFLAIVFIVITLPFLLYLIGRLFCLGKNTKTLMIQKRLSKYHLESYENEPLIEH